jgi:death-associated protein kinase
MGHVEIARMLLEYKAEVNFRCHHGCTPLHYAAAFGTPDVMQILLDHDADPHVLDSDGDTPLHCAAFDGQLGVALLLLKLNVDLNSRNNKGYTPLHQASEGKKGGNPDIVYLLLDHGADAHARNLDGQTASEVARGPHKQEIVQFLANHGAEAAE